MGLFDFLRGKPTEERYARDLIGAAARAGHPDWRHDADERVIVGPTGARLSLVNMFLEYSHAPAGHRAGLFAKALQMMTSFAQEVPKLWTLAQKSIYPVLRSRYDYLAVEIEMRETEHGFPRRAELPFHGDLVIRIAYDFGASVSQVSSENVETWGVTLAAVHERALQNFRALPRPQWVARAPGLMQIVSEVSYEESMLLRADVMNATGLRGDVLAMTTNRGILMATGTAEPGGVEALLHQAAEMQRNNPWPMTPELLCWANESFAAPMLAPRAAQMLRALRVADLAATYSDQKAGMEKWLERTGRDIFVATQALTARKETPDQPRSGATWTEGVHTWLPECDFLIFNKDLGGNRRQIAAVDWPKAVTLCGNLMSALDEKPPRFEVRGFPDPAQWRDLMAAADWVKEVKADES